MTFRAIKILAPLLMLLTLSSCIKEDLSMCHNLMLQFSYTLNTTGEDLFATEVHDVRLYIFNDKGVLCSIHRASGKELKLDLQSGRYDIIAWAGSSQDIMQGGYVDAQMTDAATHQYQTPVVGQTAIDDFYMFIANKPLSEEVEGDVAPTNNHFDNLFYGSLTNLDYKKGEGARTETIDLIKNTNKIKVRVNGLEHIGIASANIFVLGRNGRYHSNNTIGDYARTVRYDPSQTRTAKNSTESDIRLLRLDKVFHAANPILLKIQNPVTGKDIFTPIDVVKTLSQVRDANGNYLYPTQEELDRQDEYLIEINATELGVTISVDSWVIGTLKPSVE